MIERTIVLLYNFIWNIHKSMIIFKKCIFDRFLLCMQIKQRNIFSWVMAKMVLKNSSNQ